MSKNKGYALLITIVITFVMSLTALTMMSIVYRYTSSVRNRKEDLFEEVYDDGSKEELKNANYNWNI